MWRTCTALMAGEVLWGLPGGAETVCRTNALGAIACIGRPATGVQGARVFVRGADGLAAVQAAPRTREAGSVLVPGYRRDAFGTTRLRAPEVPQISCREDALGHLQCR